MSYLLRFAWAKAEWIETQSFTVEWNIVCRMGSDPHCVTLFIEYLDAQTEHKTSISDSLEYKQISEHIT